MKEANSDVIEVRLVSGHGGLEVLRNQKTLSFTEQSWMDLHGESHPSDYDFELPIRFIKYILFFFYLLTFIPFNLSSRCVCVFPHLFKCDGDVPHRSRGGGPAERRNPDDHCAPPGGVQKLHPRAAGKDERRPRG